MTSITMDQAVKEVLSASQGDISTGVMKDTLIHSIHSMVSQTDITAEVRDSHPLMQRLYEAQDGMVFYSYHDIYAFSHDLVSELPEPTSDLLVSSSETESILKQLDDETLTKENQKKLEARYNTLCKELNRIVFDDKMNGFFHKPNNSVIHVSDDKIAKFRMAEKRNNELSTDKPNISRAKAIDSSLNGLINKEPSVTDKEKPREQTPKSGSNPHQIAAQQHPRSLQSPNTNPVGHASEALGGIILNSLAAMSSGMSQLAEWSFSKVPSNKHSFLMGISKKNHSIVSDNIRENNLAMAELKNMSTKSNLIPDDILAAKDLLTQVQKNISALHDKNKRGVLEDNDKAEILHHTQKMNDEIKSIENSPIKQALEEIGFNFSEIISSIRDFIKSIIGKKEAGNDHPSPTP